ncbi:hypothetical protein I4U23_008687 [Adineta vaga]|nr:hypothetical protein I4U23_008687 [Adineta vaga]
MALQTNGYKPNFRNNQIHSLGDYVRRNNLIWREQHYANGQHDLEWHQYLRRQADLPIERSVPYGKRRRSRGQKPTQGAMISDDGDLGISKVDFTSPPVTLTWLNLQAKAPPKDKGLKRTITKALCPSKEVGQSKMLLKGVNGIVKPGQLLAIMGASGAGKTTLLNILTQRRPGNLKVTGDIRVNGTNMGRNINRVSGYVQQEELFIPSMTTREHLHFHAMLRLNRDVSKQQRVGRVDELLEFLNLKKVEKTVIGEPGRIKGLSGGEKRRLLFASEVMTDPPLLFADEPTSGLDGSMAFVICDAMRKLCNQGKTIVCTIHQPSSEIFELFDTLYLLAEGRVAYFGSRKKAQNFFSSLGYDAPGNYNLSDFYIQTLAVLPFDREASLERVEHICDEYEKSPLYAQYVSEAEQYHAIDDNQTSSSGGIFNRSSKFKVGFFRQLIWLLWRSSIDTFRNPFELRLQYNQQAFQNVSAIIFMLIINISFSTVQKNADSINRQLTLFLKEHDDGIYHTVAYYAARMVLELPTNAVSIFMLGTIVYWMANLYDNARRYFILQGILILCGSVSVSVGTLIGVLMPTPEAAGALVVPVVLPLLVFAGFFISAKTIPNWLVWIKYISWLYYSNEMALVNQWEDVTSLDCDVSANSTCFKNGTDVLNYYGFKRSNYDRNLGLLFALFGVAQTLSFVILVLRAKFQRTVG